MLQPYQQRLVEEQEQLQDRLSKLCLALDKTRPDFIPVEEWDDQVIQAELMDSYNEVLKRRISRFK